MARQARHYNSREALLTRVDYVEGKLDEAIKDLKESINETRKDLKEAIRDNKQAMLQMERELKTTLEKTVDKAESSRRWAIGSVITIAVAVIGFLLTNGF